MSTHEADENRVPNYLSSVFDDVPEQLPGEPVAKTAEAVPIETHLDLPADGRAVGGLYCTNTPARLYGTAKTVAVIRKVGAEWAHLHPDAPIGIGDISKRGGGPLSGHASHRRGVDFDVRPMRKDHREAAVTIHDADYSRELTGELIKLFVGNGIVRVTHVFFNDKPLQHPPVQPWPNHDNHFHVRLELVP